MKKISIFVILFVLLFTGCGSESMVKQENTEIPDNAQQYEVSADKKVVHI